MTTGGWRFAARTHVGLVRDGNEDAMFAGPRLLAVADGVGGSVAGEIASKMSISTLSPLDTDTTIQDPLDALRDATHAADIQLRDAIAGDPGLAGMGTTLTAMLWAGGQVGLAQLGDSRAYLMRSGELTQLTRDQSLVQSLVDEGQITEEEARVHPRRSWILRSLDGRGEAEPEVQLITPVAGDRYLLCSDGLSDYVEAPTIAATMNGGEDLQLICDELVDHALSVGAPDNVTVVVAEPVEGEVPAAQAIVGGAAAAPDRARRSATNPSTDTAAGKVRTRSIGRRLAILAVVILLLIAGAVAATTIYIRGQWYLADDNGNVAIFHGERGKVLGISLSRLASTTQIPTNQVTQSDRELLDSGQVSGRDNVADELTTVRNDACKEWVASHPATASTKSGNANKRRAAPKPPTPPSWCPQQP
ncbi:MAG TPA: protein phosphatase 2C domain-containing protein [Mycobacteriales bacterium]|nr:protein phosphatase 2C domain-containing protein [Mycobacteriales bacterium]